MKTPPQQDEYIKTALPLPANLHANILDAAKYHGCSMNAEIIARLQGTFLDATLDSLAQQNQELRNMVQRLIDELIK